MHIVASRPASSLADIDRGLAETHRLERLERMREQFVRRDAELFESFDRTCPVCGGRLLSKGMSEAGEFICLAGRFSARVHRLCCERCDGTVYPIDSEVDRSTRILSSAAEHLVRFAARTGGYEKGCVEAGFHLGIEVSASRLHRLVAKEAPLVEDSLADEAAGMLATGTCPSERVDLSGRTLHLAIDGGHVAGRGKHSFEIKCAVAWTGVAEVSKGRSALLGREGYAALESAETFFPKVAALAIRNGMLTAKRTVVLADGADWIRRGVAAWLPGALYVLDWKHLERRVREVLRRPEDEALLFEVLSACRNAQPDVALSLLKEWKPPSDGRRLHRRLVRYVRVNAEGIANHAQVEIHGSGAVEKAVDVIVSRRLKLRGMSWSENGAASLLPFLLMLYNGTWRTHWDQRAEALPHAA